MYVPVLHLSLFSVVTLESLMRYMHICMAYVPVISFELRRESVTYVHMH